MTTEIAIMNKSAIALAADSAVTITKSGTQGNSEKVLNTANKLFALSKYNPVGIMFYGNASLQGVPWEPIIKEYREILGNSEFTTLDDYCKHFFNYLDNIDIGEDAQKQYLGQHAFTISTDIITGLDNWVQNELSANRHLTEEQIHDKLRDIIVTINNDLANEESKCLLSKAKRNILKKKYSDVLDDAINHVFQQHKITSQMKKQLFSIAINAASIGLLNSSSGVVIAGFGSKELYPHCNDYTVYAVLAGKTIKRLERSNSIATNMGASIMSFAQSESVSTFMEGIGPKIQEFLKGTFFNIMVNKMPAYLAAEINKKISVPHDKEAEVVRIISEMCCGVCEYAFQQLEEQKTNNYINPVTEATGFLNKAELATMAETLVNLESFRKQVTMETETVGGPIDVAVITKGDGFVWIKRKLYFDPALNHHFFRNYYRKGNTDGNES